MRQLNNIRFHESGAALVVGLILLVVLSLMAISSMNTATLDLIMAGNEQYRTRAFTAAETGIERALRWNNGVYDSSASSGTVSGTTGIGSDHYDFKIDPMNSGLEEPVSAFNSNGKFSAIYFRITATGSSERNSKVTDAQELFVVTNASSDKTCDKTLSSCDLGG